MENGDLKHETPPITNVLVVAGVTLESDEYYKVNGTNKILYWDGVKWMKPLKDQQKRYGTWNGYLDKQPNVKSAELVDIFACQ